MFWAKAKIGFTEASYVYIFGSKATVYSFFLWLNGVYKLSSSENIVPVKIYVLKLLRTLHSPVFVYN